mgnify:FL=1
MWDVKKESTQKEAEEEKFYLNYVGCKVLLPRICLPLQTPFYLNYVGCKVQILKGEFLYKGGFTLTMWDVK